MDRTLTPKQRSAIERAKRNGDLRAILFRRATGLHWFLAFKEAGFLDPGAIPAPIPSKEPGYVSIPVWPITDYLVANSVELKVEANETYARAFLDFIRDTTEYAKERQISNYRVWWQFSKIIRNLPPHLFIRDDAKLVDYWLSDPYERGLVAESVGEHWLLDLLSENVEKHRGLTRDVLESLYVIQVVERPVTTTTRKEAHFRFSNWHAKRLTQKIAHKAGQVLEQEAVNIFRASVRQMLVDLKNDDWSSIWRPAIEDHEQNRRAEDTDDIALEAFREALLGFVEGSTQIAIPYVQELLASPLTTERRLAVFTINRAFASLRALVASALRLDFADGNSRHELWHLLRDHYPELTDEEKRHVKQSIATLSVKDEEENEKAKASAYLRSIWLSAIKDHDPELLSLYEKSVEESGGKPDHPDFPSYMSSGWVTHQSPITKEELLSFDTAQLIAWLGAYEDPGQFREPGLEGLVKTVRSAVKAKPLRFQKELDSFLNLDLPYLYEIVEAYGELWAEKVDLPWNDVWKDLLLFCEKLVGEDRFWSVENAVARKTFVANSNWLVGSISRLIENGTRSDEHAFSPEHLPQARRILEIILAKTVGEPFKVESDAVSLSINSPRGRCIEAFINLTLRCCRLQDKESGRHQEQWSSFEPIYENELDRADAGEYEFTTLIATYLPQFLYASKEWVVTNFERIFDADNYQKWLCAMQGYAYVNIVYEEIYKLLRDRGHFAKALSDAALKDKVIEKIVQNITVAYLNDYEVLTDPQSLMALLLSKRDPEELGQLIWFVWTQRDSTNSKVRGKVLELWSRILDGLDTSKASGKQIASKLCEWTAFIDEINDSNRHLVQAVTPFADEGYHTNDLLQAIARVSAKQPKEAFAIWRLLLNASRPDYPEEAIKTILENLVRSGPEGIRSAKEAVGEYLKGGNEKPHLLLRNVLSESNIQ